MSLSTDVNFKIAILDVIDEANIEQKILPNCTFDILNKKYENELPLDRLSSYDAVMIWHQMTLGPETISKMKNTKVIMRVGAGYDNIDVNAASKAGIPVCVVPDYGTEEVAESAISLMLNLMRKTGQFANSVREGKWPSNPASEPKLKYARRVSGCNIGIIGCGLIGQSFAMRARSFNTKVGIFDPYAPAGLEKAVSAYRFEKLDELLKWSDVISLHCVLSSDTRHIINKETISKMKPGTFIINTARGELIDEDALIEALKSNKLGGAGLDVLSNEPCTDQHLNDVPNLIVTPHAAFYSKESFQEMREKAAKDLLKIFNGKSPVKQVNKEKVPLEGIRMKTEKK